MNYIIMKKINSKNKNDGEDNNNLFKNKKKLKYY